MRWDWSLRSIKFNVIPLRLDRSRQRWKERVSFRFRKETLTRIINIGDTSWKENTWMTRDCRKKKRKNDLMENQYPIVSSPTDLELLLPPSPFSSAQLLSVHWNSLRKYQQKNSYPRVRNNFSNTSSSSSFLSLPTSFNFPSKFNSVPPIQAQSFATRKGEGGLINRPEQMIHWRGGTVSSSPR